MTVLDRELLTTGEAALLLRSSRQHVVDMCEQGLLPYVRVGSHRRLRRADIEAVLRPELTRDQLKALWLHRAVAGRLVSDPDAVLAKAAANLQRLRRVHPDGMPPGGSTNGGPCSMPAWRRQRLRNWIAQRGKR